MIFLLLVIHILPRSTLFTLFWDSEVKKFIIILKFEILKSVSTTLRIVKEVVRRSSVNYTQRQSSVGVMENKVFLEISQNSQKNNCARASVLIKLKKNRLWHRCFPVNFAKFWRTTFFYKRLPVAASGMYMYRGLETYIFIWLRCWTCFEKVIK